jgi:hypothetical protein
VRKLLEVALGTCLALGSVIGWSGPSIVRAAEPGSSIVAGTVQAVVGAQAFDATPDGSVVVVSPNGGLGAAFDRGSGTSRDYTSQSAALEADGSGVIVATREVLLPADGSPSDEDADLYRFDLATQSWTLLTPGGLPDASSSSHDMIAGWEYTAEAVSADGRYVALNATSPSLADQSVFRYDRVTGTLIHVDDFEGVSGGQASNVSMSSDGRFLTYGEFNLESCAGCGHAYAFDAQSGTRTVVDRYVGASPASGGPSNALIAGGGRQVLFWSDSPDLDTDVSYPAATRWFVRDLDTGVISPVGASSDGRLASISADGQRVAFVAPGETTGFQVYVIDHGSSAAEPISDLDGVVAGDIRWVRLTASGDEVLFTANFPDRPPTTYSRALRSDGTGSTPDDGGIVAVSPGRLLDTRPGGTTVDGLDAGTGAMLPGETRRLHVTGRAGIGAAVTAVALNVTATDAAEPGYVTVWPCGPLPLASNLNIGTTTVANLVLTAVDAGGDVCLQSSNVTHLIVDVSGSTGATSGHQPLQPARLLDTRPGAQTVDGLGATAAVVGAGDTVELAVAGRGGVPADATAVILNVTATGSTGTGYVTVWPCGEAPNASNLNISTGQTVAGFVVSALGPGGIVCLRPSETSVHLIVDVQGVLAASAALVPVDPARLLDTRAGAATIDGVSSGLGVVESGAPVRVQVAGRGGVPLEAQAALVNVTGTDATGAGYVTVWPCGLRPNASTLNLAGPGAVPNAALVDLDDEGGLCVVPMETSAHLLVDVLGFAV